MAWSSRLIRAALLGGLVGWLALPAAAQVVIPGTADPLRLQERARPTPTARPSGPAVRLEEPPAALPEGIDDVRFDLRGIVLVGATVYDTSALTPLWQDLLGREVSLAELYAVTIAITTKYRNDGWILSRAIIPAQELQDGIVRLEVIEGYVGEVSITGEVGRDAHLRGYADHILASRPLQVRTLERYLLLLDDLAGVTARSVLAPLPGERGAAILTVELQQKVLDVFSTMDNRGTRFIGPFQASLGGRLNSVLGLYETTQLRFINTPAEFDDLRAYDLSHVMPLDSDGTLISVGINQAIAHPGFTLRPLRVGSAATVFTTQVSHQLVRQRAENLTLSGAFVMTDLRTDLLGGTVLLLNDRIRTIQFGALYDFVDDWDGINVFDLHVSRGLDIIGARTTGSANLSRANGRSDFAKLIGDAQRVQSLGGDWSALLAVTGQYGFGSLLASEQFGIGGVNFVRAYDPAELTGDRGIAGKIELQYGERLGLSWLASYQLYGYYDAGRVWNQAPLAGENAAASATAAGAGVRFTISEQISGTLEVAKPLTRSVATAGDRDPRVFFGLVARF
ncbi:MAG: ShlB/FhaC/HecB family hemolysin secretion/activation protein [Proteobacteria bacterium]|nr:ShlB/FhaC/HecB family hemolysin secretion/activation protein [Pseudomonadota bacterium]